ncbi:unnamed protein product [Acanthoscelides obtectus]|uniref:Uncharacterized protein n=1 Tax=Acanthoscelides obtectus TaxID=200917 RepID=A0A9P0NPM2_ACAOB|nr:unnamed protein product [Acanthoscelides obtectus]CAK1625022.1 hypothetical protein AOBTE_LOCUS2899 [Acanthoscelides obtectus]
MSRQPRYMVLPKVYSTVKPFYRDFHLFFVSFSQMSNVCLNTLYLNNWYNSNS